MTNKYDDYDWEELPKDIRKAYETLGYTKKIWNKDGSGECDDEYWKDLTPEQQAAATLIGYTEATWNAAD